MSRHLKVAVFLVLAVCLLFPTSAYAHRMLIEPVEEGKVRVVFDDGSVPRHAEVTVYDDEDEKISTGEVDEEGYFSYSAPEGSLLVADDGFGHLAEYVVGEDPETVLPRGPTMLLVLSGFAGIAAVLQYRVNRKSA